MSKRKNKLVSIPFKSRFPAWQIVKMAEELGRLKAIVIQFTKRFWDTVFKSWKASGLICAILLFCAFTPFNLSQVKDCEVEQVYKWVKSQKLLWRFKNPHVITIGNKAIMDGVSHDIIGYRDGVGYYSGLYTYKTHVLNFIDGDTVVLAHEIAHAFGADETLADKIHRKFERGFIMKQCIDKSS